LGWPFGCFDDFDGVGCCEATADMDGDHSACDRHDRRLHERIWNLVDRIELYQVERRSLSSSLDTKQMDSGRNR
jgi:hypothetical protein